MIRTDQHGGANFEVLATDQMPEDWYDEDGYDEEFIEREEGISTFRLLIFASANLGVNLAWNVEFSLALPFFEQELELPASTAQKLWIFGPIAGLFVAPLVGAYSDNCTSRFGRRRPFILLGLVSILLFSTFFSNAKHIGEIIGGDKPGSRHTAQLFGILAFALNDFSINVIQFPVRVLASDLSPQWQQTSAQSMQTVAAAIGIMVANLFLLLVESPVSRVPLIFFIANIILLITVATTLIVAKESPAKPSQNPDDEFDNACKSYLRTIQTFPKLNPIMIRIIIVQIFSWLAYFCSFQILTEWMGAVVFQGDPASNGTSNEQFQRGVSFAGVSIISRAFVQLCTCFMLDGLVRRFPVNLVWSVALFIGSIALFLMSLTEIVSQIHILALVFVAALGIPYAVSDALPTSIVASLYTESAKGTHLGILNLSVCIPQLLDTLYTGSITAAFDEGYVIRLGSAYMLLASIMAYCLLHNTTIIQLESKVQMLGGATPTFSSQRLHSILD